MIKVILFDFDGVIVDSASIRIDGFRRIFEDQPKKLVDRLIDYHVENGGISRYVKIRRFYDEYLGEPVSDETLQRLADQFSAIMRHRMTDKSILIQETVAFLKRHHGSCPLHIVSGSDGDELRFLCKELEIASLFISIHGSPTPKGTLVERLMADRGYLAEETVFIGDAINDFDAARQNGLRFFGYNNPALKAVSNFYIDSFATFDPDMGQ